MLAVVPSALFAQTAGTGQVAGTVTDPSGGAIVGATVTLTDTSTNTTRTAVTNDTGRYILVDIRSGSYNMTVSKTGFRISKLVDQQVSVGNTLTLNVTLEIGSVAETVEVTVTAGAELQTMNATVGNTISGVTLSSLPAIGGDVSTFVALQPGVGPDGSVAGAVVDQSTFMLDGGQNTNDMDGSMQVYTPSFGGDPTGGIAAGNGLRGGGSSGGVPTGVMPTPSDSVEEFKVATTGQTADFNTSAGAQVQVVTKRGTNAWHGTLYEYYLDNNFNANTWQNNRVTNPETGAWDPTPLPSFHYNRFGGAVGGPLVNKEFWGGKTYFFANYQGFRWNNTVTEEKAVPSDSMRLGILRFSNTAGLPCNATHIANCTAYNLNPYSVVDPITGLTLAPGTLDPRNIGINPSVVALWKLMPAGNDVACGNGIAGSRCDTVNEIGFAGNMSVPQDDNFGVARIDHDFGAKWHFTGSYRYYKLTRDTNSQVDISSGEPLSVSLRPQQPWYLVFGLTTNVTSNTTNDFHYSFLRNYWSWSDMGGAPQLDGLGAALEPLGESAQALTPYNVDTQDVRTRFWDGHDTFIRDDWTMLKGNHLFTFGGAYQRNWDYHQRSDNGGGINYYPTYQLGDTAGAGQVGVPTAPAGANATTWARDYAAVLGIVTDAQVAYTRTGPSLALNPPLTPAFDKSTIPYYNVYWSDSWRVKPTLTLTYGLGWTLEMPPTEAQGKQVQLLDAAGQQLDVEAYLNQRKNAALAGQVYNPDLGFSLVGNTAAGQKYPYNPFYGSFSPRLAAAWAPKYSDGMLGKLFGDNKTVVRGGFSIVYGRLNGVDQVLVPLLGTGLIQPVTCTAAVMPGPTTPNGSCGGAVTAANAFRIGVDGNNAPIPAASPTLPQPVFPGINNVSAAAGEALDPNFRPNVVDSFDFTIQRQITSKILLEVGYIGRKITHEYQPINVNAVPYMMTLGGQSFAKAYAYVETQMGCVKGQNFCAAATPSGTLAAVTPQPFFEAALAGTGYCNGFASCTAAVVSNEFSNFQSQSVWNLWSDLDQGGIGGGGGGTTNPGFNFARTMLNSAIPDNPNGGSGQFTSGVAVNASVGHGNYNAGFLSLKVNNWHGLTLQQNFTMSKALGTGAVVQASSEYTPNDPWDLNNMYGPQPFDRKFVYNVLAVYELPFYKSQQGILGHVLGGWNISPIFTAGSGLPLYCNTNTDAQAFGSGDGNNFFDNEQCLPVGPVNTGSATVHNNGGNPNIFANPTASFAQWRAPILGVDGQDGGYGVGRGLPYWNLDMSLRKNIRVTERVSMEFQFLCLNTLNHMQFSDPFMQVGDLGDWGVLTTQGNTPRQMEFGLRLKF
jgi:hypothetical protein